MRCKDFCQCWKAICIWRHWDSKMEKEALWGRGFPWQTESQVFWDTRMTPDAFSGAGSVALWPWRRRKAGTGRNAHNERPRRLSSSTKFPTYLPSQFTSLQSTKPFFLVLWHFQKLFFVKNATYIFVVGSGLKNTGRSWKGTKFNLWHPHDGSQLS